MTRLDDKNVIVKLMEGWKTRLEVIEDGKGLTSRKINIRKGFLQRDSYSPVGACLMEVPISMLIDETDWYTMRRRDKGRVKRIQNLFIDDLKIFHESHRKLEVVNKMIVKANMDTGPYYALHKK